MSVYLASTQLNNDYPLATKKDSTLNNENKRNESNLKLASDNSTVYIRYGPYGVTLM